MRILVAVCVILLTACGSVTLRSMYTAKDFFTDVDPGEICAVEPLSQAERYTIVESGFAVSESPWTQFSVISVETRRLRLRDVDIHVYPVADGGGWVVSVTSILGNHDQVQHTAFYGVDTGGIISGRLDPASLGIRDVPVNEFVTETDRFPDEENRPVPRYIRDDGSLVAEPWTWLDPSWENRTVIMEVVFHWDGTGFEEVISAIER